MDKNNQNTKNKVICSPETDNRNYWCEILEKIKCDWLIVSACIRNEFMELGFIVKMNKDCTEELKQILIDVASNKFSQHNIKGFRLRAIEAINDLSKYQAFEISEPKSWDVPYNSRLFEMKGSYDKTEGCIYVEEPDRDTQIIHLSLN